MLRGPLRLAADADRDQYRDSGVGESRLDHAKGKPMFIIRATAVTLWLIALCPAGFADIVVLPDPDKWIESALEDLTHGKTDDFARNYLKLIGKPEAFDSLAGNVRILSTLGPPVFTEKMSDEKFGSAVREVVYVTLYRQTDYMYFRFVIKKNNGGWAITNFSFKSEPGEVFPAGFKH
jgi:hypothetical protein